MSVAKLILLLFVTAVASIAGRCADEKSLQDELAKADKFYKARQYEDATRILKDAVKTPDGQKSYPALSKLAKAYRSIGAYEMCVETAHQAADIASDDMHRADGHWLAGMCYAEQRGKDDSYTLAEKELHTALQLAPKNDEIHVSMGSLLMKQHRDTEGIAELKLYLQKNPNGPLASIAQALVQTPGLARLLLIPDFNVETLEGRWISSTDLESKVVLVDFWAPWCAPCRAALPHLRSLLNRYSEKQLVVISVCGDEKEDTWRNFVYDNSMDWPQYYDRYATMRRLFDVKNYPTYFIIDSHGIIRTKAIGGGPEQIIAIEQEIKKEIERLDEKEIPRNAPAQGKADELHD
jgi:thiol-disulfide isomerase/thioredoxin/Tfp pilus assembly protein PilF